MPPKINVTRLTQYAQVDPAFTEMMREIWKGCWKSLKEEIDTQHLSLRKVTAQANAPAMSRLKGLCTKPERLDQELTRLRGLPYERFYLRTYKSKRWLVGLTRPVVMNDGERRYQAPRYYVYIPEDFKTRGTDAYFHFVPEGYEMTTARHPHHKVKDYYFDEQMARHPIEDGMIRDPLDYMPSTCWGSFSTIITSCIRAGDVVDLYRNIAIYLTRIDQNSLLLRPFSACFFLTDIGPASEISSQPNGRVRR